MGLLILIRETAVLVDVDKKNTAGGTVTGSPKSIVLILLVLECVLRVSWQQFWNICVKDWAKQTDGDEHIISSPLRFESINYFTWFPRERGVQSSTSLDLWSEKKNAVGSRQQIIVTFFTTTIVPGEAVIPLALGAVVVTAFVLIASAPRLWLSPGILQFQV